MTDTHSVLERAARRATRRLRLRAALQRLAQVLPLPLGYAAGALALAKLGLLSPSRQAALGLAALLVLAAGITLWGFLRRPPRWAGPLLLDAYQQAQPASEHGQGGDHITTALAFLELPAEQRTGFIEVAIDSGLHAAKRLDVRRAVPLHLPPELWVSGALALLLLSIVSVEVRVTRIVEPPPRFEPLVLAEDDVELYRKLVASLAERAEDPDSLAAIRRFNAIIEDIAARRLERRDAFDRLSDLESELARHADLDQEARELGLRDIGRELSRSGLVKNAGEALEQKRLADAAQALRELADRLKKKGNPPSRAELDRLRGAAERASRVNAERLSAIEQRRRELEEEKKSLLKPKTGPQAAGQNAEKQAENRRKLERLNRDKERAERAARELSELDRELAKAAEDLKKDTAQGAEDLRRSAEELSKVQRRELSDQEKRDLIQRLREMKEILRQQGQSQSERQRQMARFGERARGRGSKGKGEDAGGQGQGRGAGRPGAQRELELVEVPSISQRLGAGSPSGSGSSQGKDGNPGQDSGSGREPGKGHDANVQGEASAPLAGQTQDVSAAGIDTGQGTASAEVIQGAAERGFVGKAYRDVYVQYETVAEQSLEHDNIPPGYRFYVRRYFQLIRPRE